MERITVSAVLAAILAGVCAVLGSWSVAMTTLVILMSLDIVSGWTRAFIQKELSSDESLRGTTRKLLIFVVVAVAAQVDKLIGSTIVRDAAVIFYCASEGLSIVENTVAAGLPVPDVLKDALKQLNGKKYANSD